MNVLYHVMGQGQEVRPRGRVTKELLGVQMQIEALDRCVIWHPDRVLNYRFALAEFLWILTGHDELYYLTRFNRKMAEYSDNGHTLAGAYGPRLRNDPDQFDYVARTLRDDPDSRQAVATIWRPGQPPSKDIPCTVSLQWLLRRGMLHCIVNMRSSDAWLGLPYDIFTFGNLTRVLAADLDVPTGGMLFNFGSSHVYEEHFESAAKLLRYWSTVMGTVDRIENWDPRGYRFVDLDQMMELDGRVPPGWEALKNALLAPTSQHALGILRGAE